jgi:nucleoside-diphosphate kinase
MQQSNDPKKEKTLVIIKPDGIQRTLIGEIIKRYERCGLKLIALKMIQTAPDFVEKHYTLDPEWRMKNGQKTINAYKEKGKTPPSQDPMVVSGITLEKLKKYLSCSPIVTMVWQGMNAVGVVRKITGGTEPLTADVGTIRGDYTIDSYQISDIDKRAARNLVHSSGSVEEAEMEINLWFKNEEMFEYRLVSEEILYDVNLDGILE